MEMMLVLGGMIMMMLTSLLLQHTHYAKVKVTYHE